MEQFDIPHQRVREKNMYHLHLDTARIIVISAAVIAIIIVSFLLGMNFNKKGETALPLTLNHDILDNHKDMEVLKNNVPETTDEEELSRPLDEKMATADKEDKKLEVTDKQDKFAKNRNNSTNLLTKENVSDAETHDKGAKKKAAAQESMDTKKLTMTADEDSGDTTAKKSDVKNVSRKKKNVKSKVIEVSEEKTIHSKKTGISHFAIQVASYDKKSTAQSEIKSLKEKKYDAYMDETKMDGKQYFRVRIGPLASKRQALDLLKTIQESERYQESYMVRD